MIYFTGIDSPYEPPEKPEVHLHPACNSVEQSVGAIVRELEERGMLPTG